MNDLTVLKAVDLEVNKSRRDLYFNCIKSINDLIIHNTRTGYNTDELRKIQKSFINE